MRFLSENVKSIGKVLLVMYGITALLLFLLALAVWKFQPGQGMIVIGISIVYVLSCFLGGFLSGRIRKKKKYLWGLLLGALYVLLMSGISFLAKDGIHTSFSGVLQTFFLCAGGGMFGGMFS